MSVAGSSTTAVSPGGVGASLTTPLASARRGPLSVAAELTKFRLSGMVVITTAVGFVAAMPGDIRWGALFWTVVGTALAAGSASVLNQVLEVDRDRRMRRTAARPIPAGIVSRPVAALFGLLLASSGTTMLAAFAGLLPAALALLTIVIYVGLYTPLKTRTTLNTLVGAVCGALPPMIGWAAATGSLSPGAWLLAGLLFVWQLPHFLALAWLYRADYARGGFVMLPSRDPAGVLTAQVSVAATLVLVMIGAVAVLAGTAGWIFGVGAVAAAVWMARHSAAFARQRSDEHARRVFHASLIYLALTMGLLLVDAGPLPLVAAP